MNLRFALPLASLAGLLLTGCSSSMKSNFVSAGPALTGSVHGGQQPVTGSVIQLYAAATGGYGAAATPLLTKTVTTDSTGSFTISGDYSCASANQVYLTATGGNPGLSSNTSNGALVMMVALGSCSSLLDNAANTFINMNEVTTVAAAWSLSRFMTSPTTLATSSANITGLTNAFAAANKIANRSTGLAPGTALPPGATAPTAEIYSLANILASCINTSGSTAAGTPCTQLFQAATPPGGATPTDTLTAALNIARNPATNVAALYALIPPSPPFGSGLTSAPTNWLIGIHYSAGTISQPNSLAIDASGNVWVANQGSNSVSEFASSGALLSPAAGYTGGNLSSPSGIALDGAGNAWISNLTGNSVTRFAPLGASSSSFTGGGLNQPSSLAIDGYGNVFVTNKAGSSVTELSSSGSVLSTTPFVGAGISQPTAIAVNTQ